MAEQVRVLDPEASDRASSTPPRGNWLLFALGFVVGLGVAVVFPTPAGVTTATVTTVDSISPPVAPPPSGEVLTPGIGEVIGGFPDAMVALVETQSGSLIHLLWPVAGPPVERPLLAGIGPARFGTSGRWIASMTAMPDQTGSILSVGITSRFIPLTSGVTSFAWHDSEAGDLAYTQVSGDDGGVWVVLPNREPRLVVGGLDPAIAVGSWGSWGFALHDPVEGQILLYTPAGEFRSVLPGTSFGSHPSGWVIAYDGGLMLVSAGGGVSRLDTDLEAIGGVKYAEFSPDRTLIAVRGDEGFLVVNADN